MDPESLSHLPVCDARSPADTTRRYVQFNLNDCVRVRLTDFGRQLHRERWDALWASLRKPSPWPYTAPQEDVEGWSKWQLWNLMDTYGEYVGLARENPFDLNIEFELPVE